MHLSLPLPDPAAWLPPGGWASHPGLRGVSCILRTTATPLEKLNDRWIKLIGIPAVEFGTNLFYLESYYYDWLVYFRTSLFGLVYFYLMWELVTR